MKFLKLRIENQRKIFYNECRQKVYNQSEKFEP
nr:MAG TPA: GFD1 mRNA transport factor [Caudoviricetes sp.]